MREIVVVGAGLAGLRAAETLRQEGFRGRLTIVGDEPTRPYTRPPLSKEILRGEAALDSCRLPSDALDAQWHLGDAARHLDLDRRIVHTAAGAQLPYDGLVIASGCRARPWPTPTPGVHVLRSVADAQALRSAFGAARNIVIVGAGFIGCEVAASARELGLEVTVVDGLPLPMAPFGAELGRRAAWLHGHRGVDVRVGEPVAEVTAKGVRTSGGDVHRSDLVLLALGAEPNTDWLADSGLELGNGVECDEYCFALGAQNVVAAGDVASWYSPSRGQTRIEHWTNTAEMGIAAARNLIADPALRNAYDPVPVVWSDQFGQRFQTTGWVDEAEEFRTVDTNEAAGRVVIEGWAGADLVCALAVNGGARIAKYRRRLGTAGDRPGL